MELPWSGYLYALATLAMTFTGFCSIVLVLRPSKDRRTSHLHRLFTHAYIELGFTAAAAAMLAPMLAASGLSVSLTWRWSSAIIAFGLVAHTSILLKRLIAGRERRFAKRAVAFTTITGLIILSLLANAAGFLIEPGPGPVVIAATWRLVMGSVLFMLTFEDFLESGAER